VSPARNLRDVGIQGDLFVIWRHWVGGKKRGRVSFLEPFCFIPSPGERNGDSGRGGDGAPLKTSGGGFERDRGPPSLPSVGQ